MNSIQLISFLSLGIVHAGSLAESKITPFLFQCTSVNCMLHVEPLEVEQKQLNNPTMPLSGKLLLCRSTAVSDDGGPAMRTQPRLTGHLNRAEPLLM